MYCQNRKCKGNQAYQAYVKAISEGAKNANADQLRALNAALSLSPEPDGKYVCAQCGWTNRGVKNEISGKARTADSP